MHLEWILYKIRFAVEATLVYGAYGRWLLFGICRFHSKVFVLLFYFFTLLHSYLVYDVV